jgi:hypothetical protein
LLQNLVTKNAISNVILLIRPVRGNICAVRGSAITDADYQIPLLLLAVVPGLKNDSCRIY